MKKILTYFPILFILSSCEIDFFSEDNFIKIEDFKLNEGKDLNDGVADGTTNQEISFEITSSVEILPSNRKVTISTTIGNFISNGELKKTVEIITDKDGKGKVLLQAPKIEGNGLITASTVENYYIRQSKIKYINSYPDNIFIETALSKLKDSSNTNINVYMIKNIGLVSENIKVVYELIDAQSNKVNNVFFNGITTINNLGVSKGNLVIEKAPKGLYFIRIGIVKSDGSIEYITKEKGNNKQIEVI